jgi:integrase
MLTARKVERATVPGRYPCGLVRGLSLQVTANGSRSWVLRYQLHGVEHWMGLGSAAEFGLREARQRALAARRLLADRIDPLVEKHAAEEAARLAVARKLTFAEAAEKYFDANSDRWRPSHRGEFMRTLKAYVFPVLGCMDVAQIDTPDILRVLEPIWKEMPVTADRTRNRVEATIDFTVVRGHRSAGPNPARWEGHLDQVLASPRDLKPIVHHKAMHYRDLPTFMADLRGLDTMPARALEFLILTGSRSAEVLGAKWGEIDFTDKVWNVPAARMKAKRDHRVPLSPAALELLKKLGPRDGGEYVFAGKSAGTPNHRMCLTWAMKQLGQEGKSTVHGFRSTFRDWAGETTAFAPDIAEASLAHSRGDQTVQAYARGDLLAKRRKLMDAWARYCRTPAHKVADKAADKVVVPLRRGA